MVYCIFLDNKNENILTDNSNFKCVKVSKSKFM